MHSCSNDNYPIEQADDVDEDLVAELREHLEEEPPA